jgi:hypothetical protein
MISWFFGSWIIYIVHAAFIAGVIGTFFGGIVSKIPVIGNYGAIVKAIAVPLLLVSIFAEGYMYASQSWIEEAKKFEEKVKNAEQQSKAANEKIKTIYIDRVKVVEKQKEIIKEKIKEVEKLIDAKCEVAPEAIQILNQAAKSPVKEEKK